MCKIAGKKYDSVIYRSGGDKKKSQMGCTWRTAHLGR